MLSYLGLQKAEKGGEERWLFLLPESSLLFKCINKAGKKNLSQISDLLGVCFPCLEQLVQVVWLLPGNSGRTKLL